MKPKEHRKYPSAGDKSRMYNTYANFYRTHTHGFTRFLLLDYALFLSLLPGKKILDLGSGPGRDSVVFKRRGYKPYCLDISEEMLKLCKKQNLPVMNMDMEKINLPPSSFDGVWSYTSLTTIPKIKVWKIVNALHKVLRKDGVLFLGLIEGNHEGWKSPDKKYQFARYVSRYIPEEVLKKIGEKFELVYFRKIDKKETKRNTYLNFIFKKRS